MTNLKTGLTVAVLMGAMALPAFAQAQLTKEQLLQLALDRGVCNGDLVPIEAAYGSDNRVFVTCGSATGFTPLAGGLGGLGAAGAAGLGLVLIASGGGTDGTTSTTSTTN
ncbi:hypothetical protein [Gemmobacter sp. 24YEA27]|uniref:hypothetical protein n=1 Tax=Gemmobacter sp. 24YEA27 TaxID=3040672 RepID=UPI0024B3C742|nr:hypothetical protein [Gemmobacter sp. 24YEA27]